MYLLQLKAYFANKDIETKHEAPIFWFCFCSVLKHSIKPKVKKIMADITFLARHSQFWGKQVDNPRMFGLYNAKFEHRKVFSTVSHGLKRPRNGEGLRIHVAHQG